MLPTKHLDNRQFSLHNSKEIQSLQICELEKFTYYWSSNKNNAMYSDNLIHV